MKKFLKFSFCFIVTIFSLPLLAANQCNWYGNTYPVCSNQASGWGWENNQSCVGSATCPQVIANNSSSGSQCNWYGNMFPLCSNQSSGWGWENNQSCVGPSTCPQITAGNSNGGSTSNSGSCPTSLSCPNGMSCGCYQVSGLGENKRAYVNAGAGRSFIASAMMETEAMTTNYTYGDGKSGDAFNAGAAKQNWGMMRQCHADWKNLGAGDYNQGAVLNSNRSLDVQVYNECRNYFGTQTFFAGHRNGATGLANPNTTDINNFIAAYNWTYDNVADHLTDDVRFWVSVPAI